MDEVSPAAWGATPVESSAGDGGPASWGATPVDQAPERTEAPGSFIQQLKQPWQNETLGSLLKQNMFANLARYSERSADLQPDLERQYDAGKKAGTITEPFAPWMERELAKAYQAKFSEKAPEIIPEVEWSKLPNYLWD